MDTDLLTLLVFSVLGGASAGLAVMNFAVPLGKQAQDRKKNAEFIVYVVALVLLGIGLIASMLHLGQPFRFLNGLSNPSSMISQESYWSIGLGILMLACAILAKMKGEIPTILKGLTAFAACGLLVVSALAYALPLGMIGWSDGSTVPFIILGNLILGTAILALLDKSEGTEPRLLSTFILLGSALLIAGIGYLIHLDSVGLNALIVPLVIALLIGAAGPIAVAVYKMSIGSSGKNLVMIIAVLALVGLAAARVIFFMAGVHL